MADEGPPRLPRRTSAPDDAPRPPPQLLSSVSMPSSVELLASMRDNDDENDAAIVSMRLTADESLRQRTLSQLHSVAGARKHSAGDEELLSSAAAQRDAPPLSPLHLGAPAPALGEDVRLELFTDLTAPEPEEATSFQRVVITGVGDDGVDREVLDTCARLRRAGDLRRKYRGQTARPREYWGELRAEDYGEVPRTPARSASSSSAAGAGAGATEYRRRPEPPYAPFDAGAFYESLAPADFEATLGPDGVFRVVRTGESEPLFTPPPMEEYYADLFELLRTVSHGPTLTHCYKRLQLLESKFNIHQLLNADRELAAQKAVPHRDFYNVRKVDTHVHHSASMNQKHLLRFIKHKLRNSPHEVVIFRDGQFLTLSEVFLSLRLTAYDLNLDTLDMHASNTFHRFDRFNLKYNPAGQARLREIFLKTDNLIAGRFLAEVTKEVLDDMSAAKYQNAEWRISIYGRKKSEWDKLARWFYVNRLASSNVRWLIQIPRLYHLYKRSGEVENFKDMIDNLFEPLFRVSLDPASNVPLATFLSTVVGFDSVDDESKPEIVQAHPDQPLPAPADWDLSQNPPYSYWMYYLWANLGALNRLRAARGLSTFEFRPHCGEAGDVDHLASAFLVADQINHGIRLRKTATLQYLYYLHQIGVAMSPLSNNKLFLEMHRNPFPVYFARGLNVSLSTDDPLMLHITHSPLVEEYSVAAQVWKLSSCDLCEVARNSVLQSGFEHPFKRHWLGPGYHRRGAAGNDIRLSNVPNIRVEYRRETLDCEWSWVATGDDAESAGRATPRLSPMRAGAR